MPMSLIYRQEISMFVFYPALAEGLLNFSLANQIKALEAKASKPSPDRHREGRKYYIFCSCRRYAPIDLIYALSISSQRVIIAL